VLLQPPIWMIQWLSAGFPVGSFWQHHYYREITPVMLLFFFPKNPKFFSNFFFFFFGFGFRQTSTSPLCYIHNNLSYWLLSRYITHLSHYKTIYTHLAPNISFLKFKFLAKIIYFFSPFHISNFSDSAKLHIFVFISGIFCCPIPSIFRFYSSSYTSVSISSYYP